LREFSIAFKDKTKEFAIIIVLDGAKLFFEREWFEVFPFKIGCFKYENSVFKFIRFL
jgi:hypothetical protein